MKPLVQLLALGAFLGCLPLAAAPEDPTAVTVWTVVLNGEDSRSVEDQRLLQIYRNASGEGNVTAVEAGTFWNIGSAEYAANEITRQRIGEPRIVPVHTLVRPIPGTGKYVEVRVPYPTSPRADVFALDRGRRRDDPRASTYLGTEVDPSAPWPVEAISADGATEEITYNLLGSYRLKRVTEDPSPAVGHPAETLPAVRRAVRKAFGSTPEQYVIVMASNGAGRAYVWTPGRGGNGTLTAHAVAHAGEVWADRGIAWTRTGVVEADLRPAPPVTPEVEMIDEEEGVYF
ncbi:MAG TPA: hypothetical protein VEI97_10305 [bacterium]|nr:hypothetical protein [bacterium]